MKTSDIVQLKRDLTGAIDAAGRGEFRWFILLEKLDEFGYDLIRRQPDPALPKRLREEFYGRPNDDQKPAETIDTPKAEPDPTDRLFAAD